MKKLAAALLLVVLTIALALPGHAEMSRFSAVFMDTFDTVIQIIGFAENQETFDKWENEGTGRLGNLPEVIYLSTKSWRRNSKEVFWVQSP